jgi:hypothetical protein
MISVVVYINDRPIFTRTARNISKTPNKTPYEYKCDNGDIITHDASKGFVPLVKKMLDTIDEKDISGSE